MRNLRIMLEAKKSQIKLIGEMPKITNKYLKKLYDKYNKEIFNNKLPKKINFDVSPMYTALGKTIFDAVIGTDEIRNYTIRINSNVKFENEYHLLNTFIHEMVHIYFASIGEKYVNHSEKFIKKTKEINKKYNLQMDIFFDDKGLELLQSNRQKVILINKKYNVCMIVELEDVYGAIDYFKFWLNDITAKIDMRLTNLEKHMSIKSDVVISLKDLKDLKDIYLESIPFKMKDINNKDFPFDLSKIQRNQLESPFYILLTDDTTTKYESIDDARIDKEIFEFTSSIPPIILKTYNPMSKFIKIGKPLPRKMDKYRIFDKDTEIVL